MEHFSSSYDDNTPLLLFTTSYLVIAPGLITRTSAVISGTRLRKDRTVD